MLRASCIMLLVVRLAPAACCSTTTPHSRPPSAPLVVRQSCARRGGQSARVSARGRHNQHGARDRQQAQPATRSGNANKHVAPLW